MIRKDINLYARYNKPIGVKSASGGKLSKMGIIMIVVALVVVLALGGFVTYLALAKNSVQSQIDEIESYLKSTNASKELLDKTKDSITKLKSEVSGETSGMIDFIKNSPKSSAVVINTILDRRKNPENDTYFVTITDFTYVVKPGTETGEFKLTVKGVDLEGKKPTEILTLFKDYRTLLEKEIVEDGVVYGYFEVTDGAPNIVNQTCAFTLVFVPAEVEDGGNA